VTQEGGVVNPSASEQSQKSSEKNPKVDTSGKVDTPKTPAKHGGVVETVSTLEEIARVSPGTPREGYLDENGDKVDMLTQPAGETFIFEEFGDEE
jgi:hypothetical protein